jgi:integrase/recombinase XerD
MQVREAAEEYLASKATRLTYKTVRGYEWYLEAFVVWCEENAVQLEDVKRPTIRQYLEYAKTRPQKKRGRNEGKPVGDVTLFHYAGVLRSFLRWCGKDEDFSDVLPKRVGENFEMPKYRDTVISVYTQAEVDALLRAVARQSYEQLRVRDKAIILVLLSTGMRAAELACDPKREKHGEPTGIRLANVSLHPDDSFIKIYGKGRKEREVGLEAPTRKAIKAYLRVRDEKGMTESPYLFLGRYGEPLTVDGLAQLLRRLGEDAGLEESCHAHKFRHTFAVRKLLNGEDLYMLSRLLGHSDIGMTQKYLRAIQAQQARKSGISVLNMDV